MQQKDGKYLHWLAGFLISGILSFLIYGFSNLAHIWCLLIGFSTGTIIGILKEFIWDKQLKKGTFSINDIIWTFWGSLTASIVLKIILVIIEK